MRSSCCENVTSSLPQHRSMPMQNTTSEYSSHPSSVSTLNGSPRPRISNIASSSATHTCV